MDLTWRHVNRHIPSKWPITLFFILNESQYTFIRIGQYSKCPQDLLTKTQKIEILYY